MGSEGALEAEQRRRDHAKIFRGRLRGPEDVALEAWDDSQLCRLTHPTLSAMSHDVHGFGAAWPRTLFSVITRGRGRGRITPRAYAATDAERVHVTPEGVTFTAPPARTVQLRYP
ncbi:hypothetical protein GCM10010104_34930 [Streptomyces indiaensis]|uniref:Uncharacterized protein n=1 Tax=Streptomyces indiaensis TaxID=284033 RepID=A0ABN3DN19_9ACTN